MPFGAIGRTLGQQNIRTLGKDNVFGPSDPSPISSNSYSYTGSVQDAPIPGSAIIPGSGVQRASSNAYAVQMEVKAFGAAGGGGASNCFGTVVNPGGNGGFSHAKVDISSKTVGGLKTIGPAAVSIPTAYAKTWKVVVGQGGNSSSPQTFGGGGGCPGSRESRSGGGASWVSDTYPTSSAPQLVLIAGGGGGAGRSYGGSGGSTAQGPGGSGSGGGAPFLQGNNGSNPDGSGGGGGYAGGTGGPGDGGDCRGLGGAGGTGYVNPNWTEVANSKTDTGGNTVAVTWSSDPDWSPGIGQGAEGGPNSQVTGGHGKVVIKLTYN